MTIFLMIIVKYVSAMKLELDIHHQEMEEQLGLLPLRDYQHLEVEEDLDSQQPQQQQLRTQLQQQHHNASILTALVMAIVTMIRILNHVGLTVEIAVIPMLKKNFVLNVPVLKSKVSPILIDFN